MPWKTSHIPVENHLLVTRILKELNRGADFKAVARNCSVCRWKKRGGDLG